VGKVLTQHWGSTQIVSRGRVHDALRLPAFVALIDDRAVGLATYHLECAACEIVSLNSLVPGIGIGSRLIEEVAAVAKQSSCARIWLITTNDNLPANRFYRQRGFRPAAVHENAVARSRLLKPSIPLVGANGIPIKDEWEFEFSF
jgi:GNAT superfamily N-acetyltransferase